MPEGECSDRSGGATKTVTTDAGEGLGELCVRTVVGGFRAKRKTWRKQDRCKPLVFNVAMLSAYTVMPLASLPVPLRVLFDRINGGTSRLPRRWDGVDGARIYFRGTGSRRGPLHDVRSFFVGPYNGLPRRPGPLFLSLVTTTRGSHRPAAGQLELERTKGPSLLNCLLIIP